MTWVWIVLVVLAVWLTGMPVLVLAVARYDGAFEYIFGRRRSSCDDEVMPVYLVNACLLWPIIAVFLLSEVLGDSFNWFWRFALRVVGRKGK